MNVKGSNIEFKNKLPVTKDMQIEHNGVTVELKSDTAYDGEYEK